MAGAGQAAFKAAVLQLIDDLQVSLCPAYSVMGLCDSTLRVCMRSGCRLHVRSFLAAGQL